MGNMRKLLGLVGVVACGLGCPSDDGSGTGGETDTDGTTTMMMTSTPSTSMSATSAMTDSASATTTMSTSDGTTTTGMSDTDTDTDPTDTDGTTTTGVDECEACLEMECGKLAEACNMDEDCACWVECIDGGMSFPECFGMCGVMPPMAYDELAMCLDNSCVEECMGGNTTGGADGLWEQCDFMTPCPDGLDCNPFLNYCTPMCMGDDDCPAPATGDAVPECNMQFDTCNLPCDDSTTCPDGMTCSFGANICTF